MELSEDRSALADAAGVDESLFGMEAELAIVQAARMPSPSSMVAEVRR